MLLVNTTDFEIYLKATIVNIGQINGKTHLNLRQQLISLTAK